MIRTITVMQKTVVAIVVTVTAAVRAHALAPLSPEELRAEGALGRPPSDSAPRDGGHIDRRLTSQEKERILRGGVLTLFGPGLLDLTPEDRQQVAVDVQASSATYLRWLGYFWTGVEEVGPGSDYAARWTAYFTAFGDVAARVHTLSPGTYAEFVIPELVTEEVNKIDLSSSENQEIARFIRQKTGVVLPAKFDFGNIRQDQPQYGARQAPDYVWSCYFKADENGCSAGVFMKNGIPSLSKPEGKAWVLYLAARALRSNADAIFLVPSRDMAVPNPWPAFADVVAKIRAMKPRVIIGSQQLNSFPAPPAGIDPRKQVDFTKTMIDVDIYTTDARGHRTVAPSHLDTARVPCYTLSDDANALYLPGDPNNPDPNLCIVANPVGRRPVMADQQDYVGVNVIEINRYGLPILLEYDPVHTDCGPVYLPNPDPRLTSDCNPNIRHGLNVSTIFPMSATAIRHRYIQYSYRLGRRLTQSRGFPVYVFGWLYDGEGLDIRKAWSMAQTDRRYVAQKTVLRMMPEGTTDSGTDHGVLEPDGLPPSAYVARMGNGDLATLSAAIRAVTR
jgi:hypothetical protein